MTEGHFQIKKPAARNISHCKIATAVGNHLHSATHRVAHRYPYDIVMLQGTQFNKVQLTKASKLN